MKLLIKPKAETKRHLANLESKMKKLPGAPSFERIGTEYRLHMGAYVAVCTHSHLVKPCSYALRQADLVKTAEAIDLE